MDLIYVLDCLFENVEIAIFANQLPTAVLKSSVIMLDNIGIFGFGAILSFSDGTGLDLIPADLDFLLIGNIEDGGSVYGMYYVHVELPAP